VRSMRARRARAAAGGGGRRAAAGGPAEVMLSDANCHTPPLRPYMEGGERSDMPYINFYQAKAIVEYRKKKGSLTSLKPFSLYEEFTKADLDRISHYICFE